MFKNDLIKLCRSFIFNGILIAIVCERIAAFKFIEAARVDLQAESSFCSCDKNCDDTERKAFGNHCQSNDALYEDERFCSYYIKKEIAYPFPWNFLCVMYDNYKERNYFTEKKAIGTPEEIDKLFLNHQHLWIPFSDALNINRKNTIPIKRNKTKEVLAIPYGFLSNECNAMLPVEFSKDISSSCFQVSHLGPNCSLSPFLVAKTYYENIQLSEEVDIVPYRCNETLYFCSEYWSESSKLETCNVVSEMKYEIIYDGMMQIKKIFVKFVLEDIKIYEGQSLLWIPQKFHVSFTLQDTNDAVVHSGNPGYLKDYPILAGTLNKESKQIEFNGNRWFLVPEAIENGNCIISYNSLVKFNENFVTSCFIESQSSDLKTACAEIKKQSSEYLVNVLPTHIGAFGNSESHKPGEWVPLLKEGSSFFSESCSVLVAVKIEIFYAWIGFDSNLQAKIIGARYKYADPINVLQFCMTPQCKIQAIEQYKLRTKVYITLEFIDLSDSPVNSFAPFPVLDLKLPYDFFYPFVSKASSELVISKILMIFIFIICYNLIDICKS